MIKERHNPLVLRRHRLTRIGNLYDHKGQEMPGEIFSDGNNAMYIPHDENGRIYNASMAHTLAHEVIDHPRTDPVLFGHLINILLTTNHLLPVTLREADKDITQLVRKDLIKFPPLKTRRSRRRS